jgi:primary-amine oxidase
VDGHEVRWQKWRFRVGFTPREGLVLHLLRYEDRGTLRPVIYRASLTEMFIPYGDPNPTHYRKNVFDMGEYGIGVPAHGTLVAPQLYGPHHQHIFCVRLDMMVDGTGNTVHECDSVALPPGPDNPHGNAWVVRQTPVTRESEAGRLADGRTARYWRIINPNIPNGHGDPVAYRLVPAGDTVLPFHQPDSHVIRRARFATKHLWVTAYHPDQRFPAGEYPNQHPGGDGLPAWTTADRPLENTDLVLWHTFTAHHVVRPEDWPVMPVTTVGFKLRADGFFDGNPALDLPPAEHCQHD